RYPVLVFVHGESYEWNSGNPYDGSVLASYGGVVVVTINYRLGVLGFLNANSNAYFRSPANYGLMDQIAALHWLQENIAVFGGDPTNVTIVGHGTGAACVNFLMTSSAVPDGLLFHRAVLMSGSGLSPWALVENPARYAQQVARHANCSPDLPQPHLLKCLRERPLDALLATPIEAPEFSSAFGPSIDGVVIDNGEPPSGGGGGASSNADSSSRYSDYISASGSSSASGGINSLNSVLLRKSVVSKLSRYDMLLGVVKAEAYFAFSGEDVQYGIEADRRSRILRTFVRNTYRFHLSEILATIVNEYTDWERPVQHPINIRDETLEALSDAQVVAPVVHTADLHSAARRNSYLYVFDYQTKFGDYPQRQGCIHGEELPYAFGAPLVGGLAHFPRNYTKSEMLLSEATMIYWSNFARTGNPNEPQEPDLVHGVRQERNRFKNIEWTAYEAVHKKYLNLDTKPKVKTHYRAHRLSFWLNLVPDLHRPGGDDVPPSHHMLEDGDQAIGPGADAVNANTSGTGVTSRSLLPSDSERNVDDASSAAAAASASPPQHPEDGFAAYSTALSLTIAIGCSLLILNVLIFAGVYYQRDKTRLHQEEGAGKKRAENGQMPNSICGDLHVVDGGSTTNIKGSDPGGGGILGQHHHHPHHHHQLPPPEFADLPPPTPSNNSSSGTSTLPRPPPPPKTPKPVIPALPNPNQLQSCGPESQPLLPPHNMQILNAGPGGGGTLTKKGVAHNNKMEELRV
ncbi:Neuroligin-1, partial [Zootermopsis nevadensis]